MHNDGYVVTIHGDAFIEASRQEGLDSLNHTMENNFRTKLLGRIGPNGSQKSCKFLRRTVEFTGGDQSPGTCRNASRSSAWPDARRPRRLARKTL